MSAFEQKSATEWQWRNGNRHHTVRYFATTDKLVWSGWLDTSNGPVFEEGFAQPVENFLQDGVPHLEPPQALLDVLRASLAAAPAKKKSGLFGWLRRNK